MSLRDREFVELHYSGFIPTMAAKRREKLGISYTSVVTVFLKLL